MYYTLFSLIGSFLFKFEFWLKKHDRMALRGCNSYMRLIFRCFKLIKWGSPKSVFFHLKAVIFKQAKNQYVEDGIHVILILKNVREISFYLA